MEFILIIEGMTCNGCKKSVERVLTAQPGVLKADVDLETGRATVTGDAQAEPQIIASALTNAGFAASIAGGHT